MHKNNQSPRATSATNSSARPSCRPGGTRSTRFTRNTLLRAGRVVVRGKTAKRDKATVLRADYALFLQAQHPAGGGGGQKIPPLGAGGHAAGHPLRRAVGRAVQFCQQRRRLCVSRRHAGHRHAGAEPSRWTNSHRRKELWERYCQWKGWSNEVQSVAAFDYALATTAKTPRYYQLNAINRTVEAIAAPDKTACCWSWLPAPARLTPRSRSSTACGSRPWRSDKPSAARSASCFWPTATS
jgi:hypothetical protein